jgi:hypothetical protein
MTENQRRPKRSMRSQEQWFACHFKERVLFHFVVLKRAKLSLCHSEVSAERSAEEPRMSLTIACHFSIRMSRAHATIAAMTAPCECRSDIWSRFSAETYKNDKNEKHAHFSVTA